MLDALTGRPIAGAEVDVRRELHEEYSNLDLTVNRDAVEVGATTTGDDGEFAVAAPADLPLDVVVRAAGFASARRDHVFAGDHLELALDGAAILEGRVTRARDGAPVGGLRLRGWDKDTRVERLRGTTDPGGFYRFDDLEAGVLVLSLEPDALAAPGWQTIALARGERLRRDFELADGVVVHGVVTDAATGRPIPGAEVGEGWTYRKSTRADALGEYRLLGFGGPGVYDVHARAPGYGEAQHEFDHDALPVEDTRLDFALTPARGAHGVVVGPDGEPLAGVYCAAVASQWLDDLQHTDWESATSDAQGRFRFSSLNVRLRHQLLLRADGYGTRVYDFPDAELEGDVDLGTFALRRGATLRGTLRTPDGAPLPGHELRLVGTNDDVLRLRADATEAHTSWYTEQRRSHTDGRGGFHFADVAGGSYELRVRLSGQRDDALQHPVDVADGVDRDGIELVLDLGGSLAGRVLAPDGTPVVGIHVEARPLAVESWRAVARVETRAEGRFAFAGLPDEELTLVCETDSYNWAHPDARLATNAPQRVRAGQDGEVVLVLRDSVVLNGRVLRADGAPAAELTVHCYRAGTGHLLGWETTDADGRFAFELPADEQVDVEAGGYQRPDLPVVLDLAPASARGLDSASQDVELVLSSSD